MPVVLVVIRPIRFVGVSPVVWQGAGARATDVDNQVSLAERQPTVGARIVVEFTCTPRPVRVAGADRAHKWAAT
jgi:hypothetical protein